MRVNKKQPPVRRVTVDLPVSLYKQLHVVVLQKHDSTYGHLRKALIEGLKMWIKKQKNKA